MAKMTREVVTIDEELCDGCGVCVPACAEGALQIVDGKARLVGEVYCDGLGACLGECPRGAITIEQREAAAFDLAAVEEHLKEMGRDPAAARHAHDEHARPGAGPAPTGHGAFGCPGARTMDLRAKDECVEPEAAFEGKLASELRQWPVKLYLVSPQAPYFQDAEVLIAADCTPISYAGFHPDFLKGKAVVIGCPKFDDLELYREKLTAIFRANDVKKVTVLHMEVPCCSGILHAAREAVAASGKNIPLDDVTVTIRGETFANVAA